MLRKAVAYPIWIITVVFWVLFTYGIKLQKKILPEAKVNYWKWNDVWAVFLNNNTFENAEDNLNKLTIEVDESNINRMRIKIEGEQSVETTVPVMHK